MASYQNVVQPPSFLPKNGKPELKWSEWLRIFENYLVAIDAHAFSPARKMSLLFNRLGVAGQRVFDNLPPVSPPLSDGMLWNEYEEGKARMMKQYADESSVLLE
ncbi:hypothetical protein NDU88_001686, partial [Pleurodeles waltl]